MAGAQRCSGAFVFECQILQPIADSVLCCLGQGDGPPLQNGQIRLCAQAVKRPSLRFSDVVFSILGLASEHFPYSPRHASHALILAHEHAMMWQHHLGAAACLWQVLEACRQRQPDPADGDWRGLEGAASTRFHACNSHGEFRIPSVLADALPSRRSSLGVAESGGFQG